MEITPKRDPSAVAVNSPHAAIPSTGRRVASAGLGEPRIAEAGDDEGGAILSRRHESGDRRCDRLHVGVGLDAGRALGQGRALDGGAAVEAQWGRGRYRSHRSPPPSNSGSGQRYAWLLLRISAGKPADITHHAGAAWNVPRSRPRSRPLQCSVAQVGQSTTPASRGRGEDRAGPARGTANATYNPRIFNPVRKQRYDTGRPRIQGSCSRNVRQDHHHTGAGTRSALPRAMRDMGVDRPRRPRRTPSRKDRPVTRPGSRRILVSAGDPEGPGHRRRAKMAHSFAILGVALSGTLPAIVLAVAGVAGEASLRERLAAASPERGQKVFRVCSACHSIDEGAAHTIGPNLWGVVGRPVAAGRRIRPLYARHAVVRRNLVCGAPGPLPASTDGGDRGDGNGCFRALRATVDRADLIVWLDRNSPAPADFVSKHAAPEAGEPRRAHRAGKPWRHDRPGPPDLGVLVAGEGAEETHAYCTACHSERIVAQQGLTPSGLGGAAGADGRGERHDPDRGAGPRPSSSPT